MMWERPPSYPTPRRPSLTTNEYRPTQQYLKGVHPLLAGHALVNRSRLQPLLE